MAAVGFLLIFYSYIDYHGPNVMRVARNLLFISTNTVEIVKEQMFQTTSKKVLRSSENIESYFLAFFLGFNSSLRCL